MAWLATVASRNASLPDVPHFATIEELLRDGPAIDAVALCAPPRVRRADVKLTKEVSSPKLVLQFWIDGPATFR
jgi:hypothetical protein